MVHDATAISRSPARAVWDTIKLARLQVFASGVVSLSIFGTSAMQEALRYSLLDAPHQIMPIVLCMFFACWVLSWTINAKIFALAPELLDPNASSGLIGQLTADLIAVLPALTTAMSLIQIAFIDDEAKSDALGLAFNSHGWAAALLSVGVGATLLGRVKNEARQASSSLIFTLRIFAATWVLLFSFVVIWGGTRMLMEATSQTFLKVGGFSTVPDWATFAVAFVAIITSGLLLTETAFELLPKTLRAVSGSSILRFVENRLIDMPLLLPLTALVAIEFFELLSLFDGARAAPGLFLLLGTIPFGFLLRLGHIGGHSPDHTPSLISRLLAYFPLLPIAIPLSLWILGVRIVLIEDGSLLEDPFIGHALAVSGLGFLPFGLFGLNPFFQHSVRPIETRDVRDPASEPFRFPLAIRTAVDHLAQIRPSAQRGLLAALVAAASLSAFFTLDALGSSTGRFQIESLVGPIGMAAVWCGCASGLFFLLSFFADAIKAPLVTFAVLWGVLLSILVWNDNHRVEGTIGVATCDPRSYTCIPDPTVHSGVNQGAEFDFSEWLRSRRDIEDYERYPVFIVATEGGGLRAAYFTASVLASLQDLCPKFSEHIIGISSVSGGSLGSAVFSMSASSLERSTKNLRCAPHSTNTKSVPSQESHRYLKIAQGTFASDLLTPTLVGSLFSDALQRILPVEIAAWDRARKLETAFADAYKRSTQNCAECQPPGVPLDMTTKFLDVTNPLPELRARMPEDWRQPPDLYFNLTEVESGKPSILGTKRLIFEFGDQKDPSIPMMEKSISTINLKLAGIKDLSLGSAAVLSARFPYLTPAGKLSITTGWDRRFVDGGYFENSGTWAARALADKVLRIVRAPEFKLKNIDIHLIVLRSSPLDMTAECLRTDRSVIVDAFEYNYLQDKRDFTFEAPKPTYPKGKYEYRVDVTTPKARDCVDHLAGFETANEVMSPVRAVLNSRVARGELSQLELRAYADTVESLQSKENKTPMVVHTLKFTNASNDTLYEEDVPLTWILSKRARNYLDASVEAIMLGVPRDKEGKVRDVPAAKPIIDALMNTKQSNPVPAAR